MTPAELALIVADGEVIRADAFARSFYDTLFEIAPQTRALFPDDLVAQRGKLVDELGFLVDAATGGIDGTEPGDLGPFLERATELGRRHVGYGVRGHDYASVGTALTAALSEHVADWDAEHERAWDKLYRLIADVMRAGADSAAFG